ncbi:hypothetical protein DPMN_182626 [Dreissena polymorpha]|uniref:Uncharacterized protein n=1 Tax=Dreissena polymorpha TaxID=45954 RepID=A0A9D4DFU9_DREPO|nr:hypothetical protein DPMN_182626 [Dreissena polymorpha]
MAVPISPTSEVQQGCSINDPFKHMLRAVKNAPPTGGHVFQATGTTFELVHIIGTNLLTKFHDDRTINMASRVLTRKKPRPLGGHVFPPTGTIFKLIQDIIGTNHLTKKNAPPPDIIRTNLLTKFHEDRKINVASRVLTRKNAPPPGSHVFQPTSIIFELVQDIIGVNLLTKFHEDPTINVASRVKNAPPLGSHVFQENVTIFQLIQVIIKTNPIYSHIRKNAPPLGSHVFQANVIIFKLIQYIIETNLLTKFHEDWTINVAYRLLTRKTAPPPGGHVFSLIWTKLVRYINKTMFTRNTAPPPGGHVFQRTRTIFELNQHIILTNILTNFELSINEKNVLTKFHEDQTKNVAFRVFTRQNVDDGQRRKDNPQRTTHDGQGTITKAHHEHVLLR